MHLNGIYNWFFHHLYDIEVVSIETVTFSCFVVATRIRRWLMNCTRLQIFKDFKSDFWWNCENGMLEIKQILFWNLIEFNVVAIDLNTSVLWDQFQQPEPFIFCLSKIIWINSPIFWKELHQHQMKRSISLSFWRKITQSFINHNRWAWVWVWYAFIGWTMCT